jgi:hypothetical protein
MEAELRAGDGATHGERSLKRAAPKGKFGRSSPCTGALGARPKVAFSVEEMATVLTPLTLSLAQSRPATMDNPEVSSYSCSFMRAGMVASLAAVGHFGRWISGTWRRQRGSVARAAEVTAASFRRG